MLCLTYFVSYIKFFKMLALADPEEGSRGWNLLFSETEKSRISVSKIRLKSVIFYSGPPF
jgi:hypothetical protein